MTSDMDLTTSQAPENMTELGRYFQCPVDGRTVDSGIGGTANGDNDKPVDNVMAVLNCPGCFFWNAKTCKGPIQMEPPTDGKKDKL